MVSVASTTNLNYLCLIQGLTFDHFFWAKLYQMFSCRLPISRLGLSSLLFLLIVSFALQSCKEEERKDLPSSRFVRNNGSKTVIVFVHGILGDSVTTWTNGPSYWPDLLAKDQDFDDADIFVYQYPTSISGTFSIDELAENMRLQLAANKIDERESIVFLSHSMGGLVTRDFLLKNRAIAGKVRFLNFFATPTNGSQIATYLSMIASHPQLQGMKLNVTTGFLGDQTRAWNAAGFTIPTYCAYEKRLTYGQTIVGFESAVAMCNRPLDPIDADHFSIVKPADANADSYLAFKNAYVQSRKRTDLRFRKLVRNLEFGATTLSYAKQLFGEPVAESDMKARFSFDGYMLYIGHSGEEPLPNQLIQFGQNRILGVKIDPPQSPQEGAEEVAISAPFVLTLNNRRIGETDKPLGSATFSDLGLIEGLFTSFDPNESPFRCVEEYSDNGLGLCCRFQSTPGKGVLVMAWTRIAMPADNWAPHMLTNPAQRLVAQLSQNDYRVYTAGGEWGSRTDQYCNRRTDVTPETISKATRLGYREVSDKEIASVMKDLPVQSLAYYDNDIANRTYLRLP